MCKGIGVLAPGHCGAGFVRTPGRWSSSSPATAPRKPRTLPDWSSGSSVVQPGPFPRSETSRDDATVEDDMRELGVVGLDERRGGWLEHLGDEHGFSVRPVLEFAKVRHARRFDIERLLAEGREQLQQLPVAGITSYWDFPSSCIVAVLDQEFGLPGPDLRAVVTFEHKYWSRLLQKKVAPDDTPAFAAVDVFADPLDGGPPLPYPFWLKPVKSYSSHLGFRVRSDEEYRHAIDAMRVGIHRLGDPFQQILDRLDDLPEEVARIGGTGAIAEGLIEGAQCTLEGHIHAGEVRIHGVFDIHRGPDGSTFTHYTYPSRLSDSARDRMAAIATDLVTAAGFDDGAFNIEFFVDEAQGRSWILEVNPRISQEHHFLMQWVDGTTNLEVMAKTALGEEPGLHPREGAAALAAKFFVRRQEDARVTRVPDQARISEIEQRHAPCVVEVIVEPGELLSELPDQEPYSYLVAYVHLGADDEEELQERYRRVVEDLDLGFESP